jgi:hypothetical protein
LSPVKKSREQKEEKEEETPKPHARKKRERKKERKKERKQRRSLAAAGSRLHSRVQQWSKLEKQEIIQLLNYYYT